jgi:hypothetical protein
LAKEPLISFEDLDNIINKSGLYSLTIKDRVKVLYKQYSYLLMIRFTYE